METIELLRTLCTATGVAGEEEGALAAAKRLCAPLGACRLTPLGSLICTVRPAREGGAHILLDAHLDEIGLVVTSIPDDGFIRVASCGGIDRRVLPAARVVIHGKEDVPAVVSCTPPHLMKEGDGKKAAKIEDVTLDAGLTGEAARGLIAPGDRVTADISFAELLGGRVTCKSLDDRAGCAAVIRAAELLKEECPDCGVSVVLSSMEEVGGQGAGAAAFALAPTHAIVVDVSFAKCEGAPKNLTADLGSGAMIGVAPPLDGGVTRGLRESAERRGIAHTIEVMGGKTGTNADNIAVSRAGVRTGLLSIPQRNMHTQAEVVSVADVDATAQLIAAWVRDNF